MVKFWKTRAGHCIYRSPSGIEVHQNLFYRWLTFGNDTIQTLISRNHLSRPELKYIDSLISAVRAIPGDTCLLGLGGAGAAHAIAPFLTDASIVAVEKNPEVIDVAKQYFMVQTIPNMGIHQVDANDFLQNQATQYSHLLIDLYDANAFPDNCNNANFIGHCKNRLLMNGVLAVNLVHIQKQRTLFDYIRQHFQQNTLCLPVKNTSNMIVLASTGLNAFALSDLLSPPKRRKIIWDRDWGSIAG